MADRDEPNRDPFSRAAVKQLLTLAALCAAGFVVLLALLGWAASVTGGGASARRAVDVEARTLTTSIRNEPPNLDSTRATDQQSIMLLGHVIEGLLRYDRNANLVPGVAERWDVRPTGATFWLRADARWSDGQPVKAQDFVFGWRTAVDPATASQYAFILFPVKNGEAINSGKLPPEQLGVRAVDDRTLEVEFENPIAYFDKLVAAQTYLPVREDFYRSREGRYGADAGDLLYNGPFRIASWVHGANIKLVKNEQYWNRDAVQLNALEIGYITRDAQARMNLYRDGRVADVDYLPGEAIESVLKDRSPLHRYAEGSMWMVILNFRSGRATGNLHLRRALQLVNDQSELVYRVLKTPSYSVAESLFPSYIKGEHGPFRLEHPPPRVTLDLTAAREELALAKRELGVTELPPLTLLADDLPAAVTHSQYLQEYLRRTLGLTIKIDLQDFRNRLAKQNAGEFDLSIYGWSADYDDPLSFADLFASWNLNNRGAYRGAALDAQVRIAQQSLEPRIRIAAFAEIQRILIEDVVLLPAYERGVMYVQDPRLKGVGRNSLGPVPDYTMAYLTTDR